MKKRWFKSYRRPRYQRASHMAPSSAPPERGSQAYRQNLSMITVIMMMVMMKLMMLMTIMMVFDSPNQACWSPCTSMARPKSASFTAAPLLLLARRRFSGWKKNNDWSSSWSRCRQDLAKKHQRTTPIESPEFLCNKFCFDWCMAFHQLLPKIFFFNPKWLGFASPIT